MAYYESAAGYNAGLPTLKRWLENRNKDKTFDMYFADCGYKRIAICDSGEIGLLLYEELKNTEIEVICFIDRNCEGLSKIESVPVISMSELKNQKVDVVAVCPPENYEQVCRYMMRHEIWIPSIYLKDAVYEF